MAPWVLYVVIPTRIHGVITQNDIIQIFNAMKISRLIQDLVPLVLLKQRNLPDQNNNRCTIIIQYTDIIMIHNLIWNSCVVVNISHKSLQMRSNFHHCAMISILFSLGQQIWNCNKWRSMQADQGTIQS